MTAKIAPGVEQVTEKLVRIITQEELAGLLGLSRRLFASRMAAGLILDPLPFSSSHNRRWQETEVQSWLDAGAPAAAVWREQKKAQSGQTRR